MSISLYSSATTDSLLSPKLSISSLSNAAATTLNATAPTTGQVLTYDGTELIWASVGGGGLFLPLAGGTMDASATIVLSDATYNSLVSGEVFGVELTADPTQNASLSFNALTIQDGVGTMQVTPSGLTFPDATTQSTAAVAFNGGTVTGPIIVDESATSGFTSTLSGAQLSFDGTGCYISGEERTTWGLSVSNCPAINFSDSTTQTTAGVSSDKAIANAFASSMWYAWDGYDYARNGVVNPNYVGGSLLSAGISDGVTFAAGFPATNATLSSGNYWYVSINGTLSDLFIFVP